MKFELLEIIKSILNNTACSATVKNWRELVSLAKCHNVLSYVAMYAASLGEAEKPDENTLSYLQRSMMYIVAQSTQQTVAVREMQEALEAAQIYNMAVKGSVTKRRYPDELLRTMGDIDVLYHPEQTEQFHKAMESLGYTNYQEGRKHDIYSRPPYIGVEAHRELVSASSEYSSYYQDIWSRCRPKEGCQYSYEMALEDELIFNIVHFIEHFKAGGAGIRFIIDVYVYNRLDLNHTYLHSEMRKMGILKFYENVSMLADDWFSEGQSHSEHKELLNGIGEFIMRGGIFGSFENAAASAVKEGKGAFVLHTLFPSYKDMCSMFPWLAGKPILLPYSWLVRGYRSLRYRRGNVKSQIARFRTGDTVKGKELNEFYKMCGLS